MKCRIFLVFLGMAILVLSFGGFVTYRLYAKVRFNVTQTIPPSHDLWNVLLKNFVKDGRVNYQLLHEDKEQLNIYLARLELHAPSADWSREEQLAYWINAYNAYTFKIIIDHYPVNSIKDIGDDMQIPLVNSTWDIQFIEIGGKELSLNDVEHRILRKEFNEPAIHFAIVCASKSCPPLRGEAYTANSIYNQLNEQALAFINDASKNHIATDHIELSKIFRWFEGDFIKEGSLIDYLNKYSHTTIKQDAKISFLEYDWALND